MTRTQSNVKRLAAPILLGLLVLLGACAPAEPAPYGISFYPPSVGYIGRQYTPTATASSGLPVSFALDASSTGCSYVGGVLSFNGVGTCVVNANQAGDATNPPAPQVQRSIAVHPCPTMRSGLWTGPLSLTANVTVNGAIFTGTVDLSSQGYGIQSFGGSISCDSVFMTFGTTPLTGTLAWNGNTLSSNYNGIDIVLNAPPAAALRNTISNVR